MDGERIGYDPVKFPHRDITDRVIRCFYDVYNELGFGYSEEVYHAAMVIALKEAGMAVRSEDPVHVHFRGQKVGEFKPDVVVNECVILEFKAVEHLISAHESQLINYLRATPIEVGLLLNFGPNPKIARRAFSNERKRSRPQVELD